MSNDRDGNIDNIPWYRDDTWRSTQYHCSRSDVCTH